MTPARLYSIMAGLFALLVTVTGVHAATMPALPAGAKYVAMGSSFAAGPGLSPAAPGSPPRCGRSARNYPHQLAAMRGLSLVDVTCSGAATAAILSPWGELPAQIDAVNADTHLVTVTIGGNDLGYIGNLMSLSCRHLAAGDETAAGNCRPVWEPKESDYQAVGAAMRRIAAAVRERAPRALLVFVDYPVVLPVHGICAATPLTPAQADAARALADRLEAITAAAASDTGARLIKASMLSEGHDACAAQPWMTGFPGPAGAVAYHLTEAGMEAVAEALDDALDQVPTADSVGPEG